MAATAQNHMEPLRGEGKKDDEYEEERKLMPVPLQKNHPKVEKINNVPN
jgi:hypothetical protein